jgi:epoxyqueuosine reductase
MKEAIRQRARELGFDDCRFTTAQSPESGPQFQKWLNSRSHGEMDYFERNVRKRVNPQLVLPGARSVIALAASYESPNPQSAICNPQFGIVARYARFDDYHEVLGERLKTLADFVNQLEGNGTR